MNSLVLVASPSVYTSYFSYSRRTRDELANQNAETTNLTSKLDRVINNHYHTYLLFGFHAYFLIALNFFSLFLQEIHDLRTRLEVAKSEVIKYCVGTLVSITAVGLAVLRTMMN